MSKLSIYGFVEHKKYGILPYRINQSDLNKRMFRDYANIFGLDAKENMVEEIRRCVDKSSVVLHEKVAMIKIYPLCRINGKEIYTDKIGMYIMAGYTLNRDEAQEMATKKFNKNNIDKFNVILTDWFKRTKVYARDTQQLYNYVLGSQIKNKKGE